MRVTAAKGLARILQAEGVPWVSTFPTCNVNNALGQEGMPLMMMRDERFAVALADGFSRVTGGKKIGVCTVMGGLNPAGLQMAYGALAQAYEDNSPLLCITDGIPVGQGGALHFEIAAAFKSVTKWVGEIDQPQRVPELMRRAFTALRSGQRGPVLVTLPRGLGEYDEEQYPYTPVKGWRFGPDPADVQAAVQALVAAKRPLIYVGEGIFYADATDDLLRLAELAQIPVLTSLKGKSAFPENHPLSVGTRGDVASEFLCRCDVLLAVGASLLPGHFGHVIPDCSHKTIIHCTVDERDANRTYPTSHVLLGDAGLALRALIDEYAAQAWSGARPVAPRADQKLLDEIRAAREQFMATYRPLLVSNDVPINPYRVYGDLMKLLDPHSSFVTHDSGNTRDQTSTVWEAVAPRAYLGWGNVTTLGFGLAAAMAAKLAYPERQCVNITGDAGVGYMLGNMEALVRYGIGVTTVHINNGCFAGYGPGFWGPGHDPYTSQVSGHAVADMSEAVKALGYHAEHVTDPGEIVPALNRALAENAQGRPAYVEFICSQYPVYGGWVTATSGSR